MTLPGAAAADRAAHLFSGNDVNWTVDAILAVDSRGIVRLSNRRAEELFGYTSDEMVGRPVETFVRAHVRTRGDNPTGVRKDGTEFPLAISVMSLATDEGLLLFAAVSDGRDVRATAEAPRRGRTEQPQSATGLSGAAQHDLNNLLAGILIYAGLVGVGLEEQLRGTDPRDSEALDTLVAHVRRIEDLATCAAELVNPAVADAGSDSAAVTRRRPEAGSGGKPGQPAPGIAAEFADFRPAPVRKILGGGL